MMAVWQRVTLHLRESFNRVRSQAPSEETGAELLRLFAVNARKSLLAGWLATVSLAAIMQQLVGGLPVLKWLLCKIAFGLVSSTIVLRYAHRPRSALGHQKWRFPLLSAATSTGLGWGIGGVFMFSPNPVHEMTLAIVLCCVAAISTSLYAPMLLASAAVSASIIIPSVVLLLVSDVLFYRLLGAAGIMFLLVLFWFAWVTHRGLLRSTTLVLDNQRLIDLLSASNEHLELTNQDLRERHAELAQAMNRIEKLATTDELTGAVNRRQTLEVLRQQMAASLRFGTVFSLVALDADHFKRVNDTYGHPAGDKALFELVRVIKEQIRTVDYIGRLGGEEFVCVLPHTTLAEASQCTERIRAAIEQTIIRHEGDDICVTISAGVTQHHPGESLDRLMARADAALYAAKRDGRNRVNAVAGEPIDVAKLLQARGWLYRGKRASKVVALRRA